MNTHPLRPSDIKKKSRVVFLNRTMFKSSNGTKTASPPSSPAKVTEPVRHFQMPVTEIRLSQGLSEVVKPSGVVTVTRSSIILSGRDHVGPFQMDIQLKNVQRVENHTTYIEGMKRDRKKYMNILAAVDGYMYHIGLKGKDPEQLHDTIKCNWEHCKPVKKE